jgi:hypothetical protein
MNNCHRMKQYTIDAHNIKQSVTVLQMNLRGKSRGSLHERKGELSESSLLGSEGSRDSQMVGCAVVKSNSRGLSGLSPLRSDGSRDGQAGRVDGCRWWPKALKPKLKGNYKAQVYSDEMVLLVVWQ